MKLLYIIAFFVIAWSGWPCNEVARSFCPCEVVGLGGQLRCNFDTLVPSVDTARYAQAQKVDRWMRWRVKNYLLSAIDKALIDRAFCGTVKNSLKKDAE